MKRNPEFINIIVGGTHRCPSKASAVVTETQVHCAHGDLSLHLQMRFDATQGGGSESELLT